MHLFGLNWQLQDAESFTFENGQVKPEATPTNSVTALSADSGKETHTHTVYSHVQPTPSTHAHTHTHTHSVLSCPTNTQHTCTDSNIQYTALQYINTTVKTLCLPSAGQKQMGSPSELGSPQGFFQLVREFFLASVALGLL